MGNRTSTTKSARNLLVSQSKLAPVAIKRSRSVFISDTQNKSNAGTHTINCGGAPHYKCDACKRIVRILKYYHEWNTYHVSSSISNPQYEMGMFEYICNEYNLTQLNDDHIHITEHHDDELEALYYYTLTQLDIDRDKGCNIISCAMMQRNHRSRSKTSLDNTYRQSLYNGYERSDEIQCQQTLDKIHSYLLHSFDCLKLTNKEIEMIDEQQHKSMRNTLDFKSEDNDSEEENEEMPLNDAALQQYKKIMDRKKNSMRDIAVIRQQSFKFASVLSYDNNDIDHTGNNEEEEREIDVNTTNNAAHQNVNTYCFGIRWYYWPYYKDLEQLDEINLGLYRDFYVENTYKDLKDEITSDSEHRLSIQCWNDITCKASSLLNTTKGRSMKASISFLDGNTHFEIANNESMQLHHIISLLLYANFTELQEKLTETFRPNTAEEKQDKYKQYILWFKRHARYHFWSKYLRESVECFGIDVDEDNHCTQKAVFFYHGINRLLYFRKTVARFCGPLSVTPEIAVAQNFSSATGLILKIKGYEDYLRMFNVSWLSDYTAESERLFIGGFKRLAIESIINVSTAHNYLYYMKAINNLFDLMNGFANKYMFDAQTRNIFVKLMFYKEDEFKMKYNLEINDDNETITNKMVKQWSISIPQYIKHLFAYCCSNMQPLITLNIDRINSFKSDASYKRIKWLFIDEDDVWCKLDRLCMLFVNLKCVIIKNGLRLHQKTFNKLIHFISSQQTKQILNIVQLKEIIIVNPKQHLLTIQQAKHQYAEKINQFGWKLSIGSSKVTAQYYVKITKVIKV